MILSAAADESFLTPLAYLLFFIISIYLIITYVVSYAVATFGSTCRDRLFLLRSLGTFEFKPRTSVRGKTMKETASSCVNSVLLVSLHVILHSL